MSSEFKLVFPVEQVLKCNVVNTLKNIYIYFKYLNIFFCGLAQSFIVYFFFFLGSVQFNKIELLSPCDVVISGHFACLAGLGDTLPITL